MESVTNDVIFDTFFIIEKSEVLLSKKNYGGDFFSTIL